MDVRPVCGTPGNTLYPLCRSSTDPPRELQPTSPQGVGPASSAAQSEAVPLATASKPAAALINSPGLPTGTHMCLHSEILDGLTRYGVQGPPFPTSTHQPPNHRQPNPEPSAASTPPSANRWPSDFFLPLSPFFFFCPRRFRHHPRATARPCTPRPPRRPSHPPFATSAAGVFLPRLSPSREAGNPDPLVLSVPSAFPQRAGLLHKCKWSPVFYSLPGSPLVFSPSPNPNARVHVPPPPKPTFPATPIQSLPRPPFASIANIVAGDLFFTSTCARPILPHPPQRIENIPFPSSSPSAAHRDSCRHCTSASRRANGC